MKFILLIALGLLYSCNTQLSQKQPEDHQYKIYVFGSLEEGDSSTIFLKAPPHSTLDDLCLIASGRLCEADLLKHNTIVIVNETIDSLLYPPVYDDTINR